MPSRSQTIAIVTPFLADANNGNWRTAQRWQAMLAPDFQAIVQPDWPAPGIDNAVAMIALHARRSAPAARRFHAAHPERPLILVMTGTDLYRDLASSEDAQETLRRATAVVVLQDDAVQYLPRETRRKTHVVYQSARALQPANKPGGRVNVVVVGHLRPEKSPQTIFDLVGAMDDSLPIHVLQIGSGLDEKLAARAQVLSRDDPHYHWAGALPHGLTRAAIKRAHLLIHPSIMEGGANVIVEAIQSGTPVLASRMSGNLGMLGPDYPGYFPVGDHLALLAQLRRCLDNANFLTRLNVACRARSQHFSPEAERNSLLKILSTCLPDRD